MSVPDEDYSRNVPCALNLNIYASMKVKSKDSTANILHFCLL